MASGFQTFVKPKKKIDLEEIVGEEIEFVEEEEVIDDLDISGSTLAIKDDSAQRIHYYAGTSSGQDVEVSEIEFEEGLEELGEGLEEESLFLESDIYDESTAYIEDERQEDEDREKDGEQEQEQEELVDEESEADVEYADFTYIEQKGMDSTGNEIKIYKRVPIGETSDEVINEEEVVDEEVEFKIVEMTVLVKEKNHHGDYVNIKKLITKEIPLDKKRTTKKVKVLVRNNEGQDIEEEIELADEIEEEEIPDLEEEAEEEQSEDGTDIDKPFVSFSDELAKKEELKLKEGEPEYKAAIYHEYLDANQRLKSVQTINKALNMVLEEHNKAKVTMEDEIENSNKMSKAVYIKSLLEFDQASKSAKEEIDLKKEIMDEAENEAKDAWNNFILINNNFYDKLDKLVNSVFKKINDGFVCVDLKEIMGDLKKVDAQLVDNTLCYWRRYHKEKLAMEGNDTSPFPPKLIPFKDFADKEERKITDIKQKLVHTVQLMSHTHFKSEQANKKLEIAKRTLEEKEALLKKKKVENIMIKQALRELNSLKPNDRTNAINIMENSLMLKDSYDIVNRRARVELDLQKVQGASKEVEKYLKQLNKKVKKASQESHDKRKENFKKKTLN